MSGRFRSVVFGVVVSYVFWLNICSSGRFEKRFFMEVLRILIMKIERSG